MRVTSTTTSLSLQKRRHALRVGGMVSRLRGNDGVCLAVKYYQNSSCLGNKHAGYKRIFEVKTSPISASAITVNVDQTAPILRIESPEDKAYTSASKIDIRGMVNDAVEALNGAPEPTVSITVNGKAADGQASQVSDRYFLIPEVPLQIGANTLRITATDHLGNARSQDIQVSRIAAGSDRLTLLGGNRQSAAVNTELAKPLSIIALNAAGEPIANLPVNFDIMRGTGTISTSQGTPVKTNGITPARNLIVNTDANGKAQVWLTVGKQTGPGANVVKASHVKFGEEVTFTASTQRGAVFKISADLGTNQIAETNAQPLELLSAVVRDAQDNLLPNIPVVLTIEAGDASFPDSTGAQATAYASGPLPDKAAQRIVLNTDKNGLIALRPLIGNLEGTVRIKAQALKTETGNVNTASDPTAGGSNWIGNATFLIQAKEAKDGPASFKGYVYDDKSRPLANVKVSIGRTASVSTTDANGLFQLDNIPPGRIDLFVDGRTVNPITAGNLQANDAAKPQYPSLHFEAYAIKGRDNQIAHPIYLPPLSTSPDSVKTVGGNEDVILTIPGLAGFQMKVKANSVTFPDGSRVGTLVVSPVTADKLPMAPPAGGAQFGVPAWTVQPAGTRFDPPIEVTLPNASSQPAGDNLPIVQWDHDLGQYVAMGRATVSEDGSVLITDSGSGLTKAGWGGLCRYDPDKCGQTAPPKCGQCERLTTGNCPTCEPDPTKEGNGHELKIAGGWSFGFESPFKSLPVTGGANFEAGYEGSLKDKCCKDTGRLGFASTVAGQGTLGVTAEGRLWGWDWHVAVDGEIGLFVGGRVAGGLKAELERDGCENETSLKAISGVITGELGAYAKLEVNGGKAEEYGLSLKPLAAVAEAELNYFSTGKNTCASQVKLAGTVKSEVEFGSRKFTVFSFSRTIELGPYPETGLCQYLTKSTKFQ